MINLNCVVILQILWLNHLLMVQTNQKFKEACRWQPYSRGVSTKFWFGVLPLDITEELAMAFDDNTVRTNERRVFFKSNRTVAESELQEPSRSRTHEDCVS